jgi:pimeloyl-ACP methyl ester carboxylesterase
VTDKNATGPESISWPESLETGRFTPYTKEIGVVAPGTKQRNDPTAESDGVDIRGPNDGPSVVFVHGAVFTRAMWAPQRDALASDRKVIALDLPGHGTRSDEDFEFDVALNLLESVVDKHATDELLVVGLSLGGYLATEYVSHHPDRVDGVVLSGCSVNPVDGMELLTRAAGGITRLATRSERVNRFVDNAAAKWVRKQDLTEEHKNEIIDSGFYPKQFGNAGPDLAGRDFRAALATYPGLSLILNGERDVVMRRDEGSHAAAAQHCEIEIIENAGHVANLPRPAAYTDKIRDFMRQTVLA